MKNNQVQFHIEDRGVTTSALTAYSDDELYCLIYPDDTITGHRFSDLVPGQESDPLTQDASEVEEASPTNDHSLKWEGLKSAGAQFGTDIPKTTTEDDIAQILREEGELAYHVMLRRRLIALHQVQTQFLQQVGGFAAYDR